MKKIYYWSILILIMIAFLPQWADAQSNTQRETHVTASQALNVGYSFMRTGSGSTGGTRGGTQNNNVSKQAMQLVYTGQATDSLTGVTTDCYYVFALQPKGFVIVAADERVEPILGYSYDNNFVVDNMPDHVRGWFGNYERQIESVTKSNLPSDPATHTKWVRLKSGQSMSTRSGETVGPLLTTTWDQGQYYNALCPADAAGPDGHALTGCVATAMAQIINYWGYPVHGRGIHSYESNYGTLMVNYDSANYDYTNMPSALTATSTAEEVNAVATLMRDCGVAVNMGYGADGSGTNNISIRVALVNNYLFSDSLSYVCKQWFQFSDWDNMLRQQLNDSFPVIYSGSDIYNNVGHSFICDGYNVDGFFHFNFGWSGNGDGWFRTSSINPGSYEFDSSQAALINIKPTNNNSTILNYLQGKSFFRLDTTLHVYYSLGLNELRGVQDYMYWDWDTLVFYPSNEGSQVEFNLNRHPNVYNGTNIINVFDGENADSLLHQYNAMYNYWNGTLNPSPVPIISTRGALTIECMGADGYDGFDFVVSEYNGCSRVSNVTTKNVNSSILISWTENGTATQWQIEYGMTGFEHGFGTVLTVDSTSIMIDSLSTYVEYDVYVRPICDDSLFGEWSQQATFIVGGNYWKDVVLSQPEGYQIGQDSDIYISSAEGLAWLINVVNNQFNQLDGWTVHLTNNIDLFGYTWTPIDLFKGRFEGHGHVIQNMYVFNDDEKGGLFGECRSPIINDVHLRNVHIKARYWSGCVAGLLNGMEIPDGQKATLMNCSATGVISSQTSAGGLVGGIWYNAEIINCWTSCNVSAETEVGGICGSGYKNCLIQNCVTYGSVNTPQIAYAGALAGYSEYTVARNSYALLDNFHPSSSIFDKAIGSEYYDLQWFSREDTLWRLLYPVAFENDTTDNLIKSLNYGAADMNIEGIRTWVADPNNNGLPTFGSFLEITCPNVTDLDFHNIIGANNEKGIVISWTENGDATVWELKYHLKDSITENHILLHNNPDTLYGFEQQQIYLFSIRPLCDSANHGAWSDYYSFVVDKPYWVDMVKEQPDGYTVDAVGNVTINSAEGLAWLISTVNGLNGQSLNDFSGKTVSLTQNINIGQYKWTAIENFLGSFDGGSHTIEGLYINELTDYHGLFGKIYGGKYLNIIVDSTSVIGKEYVGILFGLVNNANIINCHTSGTVYGELRMGGIAGSASNNIINLCSSGGTIQALHHYAGGLIGEMNTGSIRNSYSNCSITINGYSAGGIVGPCYSGIIENCYATGNVSGFMYNGGILGSLRSPQGSPSFLNNCYTAGSSYGSAGGFTLEGAMSGVVVGVTDEDPHISYCYGLVNNSGYPIVGPAEYGYDNGYPVISDTSLFTNSGVLLNSVTIAGTSYIDLLDALNAWVDANNTEGQYRHWAADTAMVNGGFPVFAAIPCPEIDVHDTIVVCDSYTWHGMAFTADTLLTDTLSTFVGCDSVVTHHIIVNHPVHTNVTEAACDSYEWNGETYTISRDYDQTFTAVNGCDSIVTLHLIVNYSTSGDTTAVTCDSFDWYEQINLTQSGDYTRIITNVNGCDSLVTLHLTINPTYNVTDSKTICASQLPYEWNGVTFNATGTQSATLPTVNGCDSVVTMTLYVNPTYNVTDSKTICASQLPYEWNGVEFTAAGTQSATLSTVNGCDSVVTMTLTVNPTYSVTDTKTICQSQLPYEWNGITFNAAGTQFATLQTVNGCDSVVTMTLTVNPIYNVTDTKTICQSQLPYTWNGVTFTTAGTQSATLPTVNGCDSVVEMTLTVNPTYSVTDERTVCENELPILWNSVEFIAAGTQSVTLSTVNGCDSVVTMTLTVNPTYSVTDSKTICASQLPYEWNGITFTTAGMQSATLPTVNGCDSVVTMTLTVNPTYNVTDSKTICASQLPYEWNGVEFNAAGTQSATLSTVNGCDSVVTMTLIVNPTYSVTDTKTICQSQLPYTWNGVIFNAAGTQSATLQTVNGCDSVVTMTLTVNPTYSVADSKTICASLLPYTWNGITFDAAGTQSATLSTENGCDSVVTMTLTVNPTYSVTDTKTICQSQLPYEWNGVTFNAAGTQSATLSTVNGCDSVVTMTLTVNPTYSVTDTKTICQSQLPYEWNGVTFNAAGTQSATLQTLNGCDSVVTMTLIVNPIYAVTDAQTICESELPYTWNGITFTAAGTQSATLPTVNGCDSVVTMTLTVNPTYNVTDSKTICASQLPYEWNGVTFNAAGTQSATLQTVNGCDSVVVMTLIVNQPTTGTDVQVACGSYTWIDGVTYTESNNTATYTLTNAVGCDSVVTLNLTINQPTTGIDVQTACGSYTWIDGITYTESNNTATYTLTNAAGCDSVVTLNLTIYSVEASEFSITTEDSCYIWNSQTYCISGDYTQTLQTVNGCDSVVTLHLTITVGIDNHDTFDFKVYPNPTTGVVNVQITNQNSTITEFRVYDAYGKLIRVVDGVGANNYSPMQTAQIDLSGLANGVYFVKAVVDGNTIAARKVIKNQ